MGDKANMRQGTYANGKFYIQNKMMVLFIKGPKDGKESTLTSTVVWVFKATMLVH